MTGRTTFGLVLGGGGVLGAAWMAGALAALRDVRGFDPADAEVMVGTSAGAVTAALLAGGVGVEELVARQRGEPVEAGVLAGFDWDPARDARSTPPRPRLRPGNAGLVVRSARSRQLRRMPPTAVLAALLPEGRGSLDAVGGLAAAAWPEREWPRRPALRIVAMDFETGARVAFGASSAPVAGVAEAVMASCAIPGWFAPVAIGGRRYVDGGAYSATSADLLAGAGLDEVYVLAPMVSFATDHPRGMTARLERGWRGRVTRRCVREVASVRHGGTRVCVLGPGPADLAAMGANLMAPDRREVVLETSRVTSAEQLADPWLARGAPRP
jgi:NTE family protein